MDTPNVPLIGDPLYKITDEIDKLLRKADLKAQRTAGGWLERLVQIDRHTLPAVLWPSLVNGLMVFGTPASGRALPAAAAGIITAVVLTAIMRRNSARRTPINRDLIAQCAVVLLAAAVVWWVGGNEYQDTAVYRHLLVVIAAALAVTLLVAAFLARPMFASLRKRSRYKRYLTRTELFAARGARPRITALTFVTAFVIALFRAPFALLTIPAIVTLLVSPIHLTWAPALAFGTCFAVLFVIGLNERIGVMWTMINAVFFRGGAAIVSTVIILLAAARIRDVSYVTTIFDNAAGWSLGALFFGAYTLSWWYDYWTNRLLAEEILALVDPASVGTAGIAYPIDPAYARTRVPPGQRVLQIHGPSRVIALQEATSTRYFQAHDLMDFVSLVSLSGAPGGMARPPALQVKGRIFDFHSTVAVLLVAILWGTWTYIGSYEQMAEVTLDGSGGGLPLEQFLTRPGDDHPLILVAASGGGTRAAVFTAAVLEGLHSQGHVEKVVVGSGVSGGGAALAYFAANRPGLIAQGAGTWDDFLSAMQEPYIRDVIDRAFEWRMVEGGRLGMLLNESFKRRWNLSANRDQLSEITDMGLMFNASLAGHLERPDGRTERLSVIEQDDPNPTVSTVAGGRLIMTNLALDGLTAEPLEPGRQERLPVVLRNDALTLHEAAALHANFPPVFSNAAIDVGNNKRFWVTDGGAVDNRGLDTLLFAVRKTLGDMRSSGKALPRIHVVMAEASAYSDGYSQDRGVGSLAGAGNRYASHLNAELAREIESMYGPEPNRFAFSYVTMPRKLRESGSFGTHWMLQARIKVSLDTEPVELDGAEMVRVLRALHTPGQAQHLGADGCKVLKAVMNDPSHADGWRTLLATFGVTPVMPSCS